MSDQIPSMLDAVGKFIEHQRGLGYTYGSESFMLRTFARYADRHAPGNPLTTRIALEWATAPQKSATYHAKRLDAVRSFARYLAVFDPQTEIPPLGILGRSYYRVEPHIYSDGETVALIRAAQSIKPLAKSAKTNPLRNATIIGLLACTGMRIGEVLALEDWDVDLRKDVIMVRQSKRLPMRLVPIMPSVVRQLRKYVEARDLALGPVPETGAFIQSSWGGHLSYESFFYVFEKIREKAGITKTNASGRKPRAHDFRHTFACRHLLRAYREDRNIDDAVHELSVYLGHANLKSTYWYLTGIPLLFEQCAMRFEAQADRHGNGGEI